jgi:hypothetical protein
MGIENELFIRNCSISSAPYQEHKDSPLSVIRESNLALQTIYSEERADPFPAYLYLSKITLSQLDSAVNVLPTFRFLSRELQINDVGKIKQYIGNEGAPEPIQNGLEILDISHLIFVEMPDKYASAFLPMGFSRRGNLRPPTTVQEYETRFDEMRKVLDTISSRKQLSSLPLEGSPSVLRTRAYFDVGSKLPPPSKKEKSKSEIIFSELNS